LDEHPDTFVLNLDALTYAGNLENLKGYTDNPHHVFVKGDINDAELVAGLIGQHKIEAIINFAAESHVDRSLVEPGVFIETNVKGTLTLLKIALDKKLERFVQVSTDEVYGSLGRKGILRKIRRWLPIHRIQPARPRRICWCGRSGIAGGCRLISRAALIITARTSFRKR